MAGERYRKLRWWLEQETPIPWLVMRNALPGLLDRLNTLEAAARKAVPAMQASCDARCLAAADRLESALAEGRTGEGESAALAGDGEEVR